MKKCFGYVRVSTQKQGEGVSLEAQRDAIEAYARKNDILISRWFEEKVTAAKKGRPVFNAVIKSLLRHEAQGLVVHKIDRSARNFADWAKIGDLSDAGIDVHFATESLDFRTRGGRLSADIQAVIAADYIRNLREECSKGINGRLKQGLCPWGAPVGYLNNGKGKPKTPDPVKGPLVRELFELYASGAHSLKSVRLAMARRGLVTPTGRPLALSGIAAILSNPFYCGIIKMRSGGESYAGVHEPIIGPTLFAAVQSVKTGKVGKKISRHDHLYAGLFRCAHCQTAMIPERQKGHVYYRCHTPDCATTSVREEAIADSLVPVLASATLSPEQCSAAIRQFADWFGPKRDEQIVATLNMQLTQIEQRLSGLTDGYVDHVIDRETFVAKKEALLFERGQLKSKLADLSQSHSEADNLEKFLELLKTLAALYETSDRAEKRQIVELTTSNRAVSGKTISLEPQDWLLALQNVAAVHCGAPTRITSRMSKQQTMSPSATDELTAEQAERLFAVMKSEPVQTLYELLAAKACTASRAVRK